MSRWRHAGVMMACGHLANGEDSEGNPICAICIGIREGANKVAEPPKLEERMALCACGRTEKSSPDLPFFEYKPNQDCDFYYCGHMGWD